jgi:hypothetical protein
MVLATLGESRIIDILISDSLGVFGWLFRRLSFCD